MSTSISPLPQDQDIAKLVDLVTSTFLRETARPLPERETPASLLGHLLGMPHERAHRFRLQHQHTVP
jgi:hypothetical protein